MEYTPSIETDVGHLGHFTVLQWPRPFFYFYCSFRLMITLSRNQITSKSRSCQGELFVSDKVVFF